MGVSSGCRELAHAFARIGGVMVTPSAGGEKASVDNGMQTAIVGPKLVGDVILSFHLWLLGSPIFRGTNVFDSVATR